MSKYLADYSALETHLARHLRELPIPLCVLDREGTFRWLNDSASALLGDVVGRTFSCVVAPEQLSIARQQFAKKVIGQAPSTNYELTLLDPAGQRIRARIRSLPLCIERVIVGVFGVVIPEHAEEEKYGWDARSRCGLELTPRQHEVLGLLGDGLGTREIAGHLGISEQTARNHVRAVLRALGAHSRLQAVAIAHRLGLLTTNN
jgi:DNA-binding CsgD family transcriptional regulator